MIPRKSLRSLAVALCLVSLSLASCSRSEGPGTAAVQTQSFTEQTKEAIQDYGRRPIDKARMTQNLGDQRTEAMDTALKDATGR